MQTQEAAALYLWSAHGLALRSRVPIPAPIVVRAPAALLNPIPSDSAVWILTDAATEASLLAVSGEALAHRSDARSLPWAGSADGLRFRPGTSLVEGRIPGLRAGPFLTIVAAPGGLLAVRPDGRLLRARPDGPEDTGLRVGSALAGLWPGIVAASSPRPPGTADEVLLLSLDPSPAVASRLPVEGTITALAGASAGSTAELVAAVAEPGREQAAGTTHLEVFRVGRTDGECGERDGGPP